MTAQQLASMRSSDGSDDGSNDEPRTRRNARRQALADLLSVSPDAAIVVDDRGVIAYANPLLVEMLGVPLADLIGKGFSSLCANPLVVERRIHTLNPGERITDCNLTLHRADGSTLETSLSAVRLDDGDHHGIVAYLRDVSPERQIAADLRHKNEELEHCVQALAHDLRSPLVALLGFSRLLRQDYEKTLDETGLHFVDRIEQAGQIMEDLIHDLLELSRIAQPGEQRTLVDPRLVLLQVRAELNPRLSAASVRLDLPEAPPEVFCDRTRLYQVFSNLIANAIDHMGPCESPHIEVTIAEEPDTTRLTVRDNGRGIDPEHHRRIFDVFQSLGPRADGRRGTGIGLAIVRKIAETHGGRVTLESQPGEGAAFHVLLPRS
jgi:PAS domain S-box-containing protein